MNTLDYMLEVMTAAKAGKSIEARRKPDSHNEGWVRVGAPIWDWHNTEYRVAPDLAPGHNPAGLTVKQVGEGWRLLSEAEKEARHRAKASTSFDIQQWHSCTEDWSNSPGVNIYSTCRTKLGSVALAALLKPDIAPGSSASSCRCIATGNNPDKLTKEQVGEGWRLLTKDEVQAQHEDYMNNRSSSGTSVAKHLQYWHNFQWENVSYCTRTDLTTRTKFHPCALAALLKPAEPVKPQHLTGDDLPAIFWVRLATHKGLNIAFLPTTIQDHSLSFAFSSGWGSRAFEKLAEDGSQWSPDRKTWHSFERPAAKATVKRPSRRTSRRRS